MMADLRVTPVVGSWSGTTSQCAWLTATLEAAGSFPRPVRFVQRVQGGSPAVPEENS